jgi:hypothetical protein
MEALKNSKASSTGSRAPKATICRRCHVQFESGNTLHRHLLVCKRISKSKLAPPTPAPTPAPTPLPLEPLPEIMLSTGKQYDDQAYAYLHVRPQFFIYSPFTSSPSTSSPSTSSPSTSSPSASLPSTAVRPASLSNHTKATTNYEAKAH